MNDPELDGAIQDGAEEVEETIRRDGSTKGQSSKKDEYSQANRWWMASTAFPLLAGTFGPMANAFSIFALVQHWRVEVPPGGSENYGIDVQDPKWLLAINGISLVVAVIANMALLLNMAKRLRFIIAQPITVIGFYLASLLLIGIIIPASKLRGANHTMTSGFWYGVMAAVIYFFIATLMLVTVYGALKGHYSREFQLTMSQRTLMLQTMSYLGYLLAGAAVYSRVEGWSYLDAVYWANTTLLTIGLGDFSPQTHTGRSLLFPFAVGGIVILGLVIGSIRSLVLDRGKKKMDSRIFETQRLHILTGLKTNSKAIPKEAHQLKERIVRSNTERERRKAEFSLMRLIQEQAAKEKRWVSLSISVAAAFTLWFVGAVVFYRAENSQKWSYFVAVYTSYTSLLTIGYGDPFPSSNAGKAFYVFWTLLAVPTLTILISNMGDTIIKSVRDITIWVGEWTVLPSQEGFKASLGRGLRRLGFSKMRKSRKANVQIDDDTDEDDDDDDDSIHEEAPGIFGDAPKNRDNDDESSDDLDSNKANPILDEKVENKDQGPTKHPKDGKKQKRPDPRSKKNNHTAYKSEHHRHYLLAHEIKSLTSSLHSNSPRKFSFKEWEYYLSLLGHEESSPERHNSDIREELEHPLRRGDKDGKKEARREFKKENDFHRSWSWVGKGNPLTSSHLSETEWLLQSLCAALEAELAKSAKQWEERLGGHSNEGGNEEDS